MVIIIIIIIIYSHQAVHVQFTNSSISGDDKNSWNTFNKQQLKQKQQQHQS